MCKGIAQPARLHSVFTAPFMVVLAVYMTFCFIPWCRTAWRAAITGRIDRDRDELEEVMMRQAARHTIHAAASMAHKTKLLCNV